MFKNNVEVLEVRERKNRTVPVRPFTTAVPVKDTLPTKGGNPPLSVAQTGIITYPDSYRYAVNVRVR
jgi:hypothetical protein